MVTLFRREINEETNKQKRQGEHRRTTNRACPRMQAHTSFTKKEKLKEEP